MENYIRRLKKPLLHSVDRLTIRIIPLDKFQVEIVPKTLFVNAVYYSRIHVCVCIFKNIWNQLRTSKLPIVYLRDRKLQTRKGNWP